MNLKKLLDNVLVLGSNISIREGKEIYKKKLVSNLNSKSIDGIYHIYSRVEDEDNKKNYSCHLKIDLKSEKVLGATCNCDTYGEFSKHKKNYICKHIIATIFYFYIIAKEKVKKSSNEKDRIKTIMKNKTSMVSKNLNLDFEIKENFIGKDKFFDVFIRIGEKSSYLVTKVEEFLECKKSKKVLRINGEFLYNPHSMKFSDKDEKVLNYIYDNLKRYQLSKEFYINDGRTIRINEKYFKEFLEMIDSDKKIRINYDYVNYESNILKENLPLSFTVKMEKENIVLTSKKKLPIPLNKEFTVFINERQIYIPEMDKSKIYKPLWEKLRVDGKIEYKKEAKIVLSLLNIIKTISSDINLGEGIKRFCSTLWKTKLYFYRENCEIKCKATINYLGDNINICDENIKSVLRDEYFEDEIIRRLERLRFIKRDKYFIFIGNDDELYEFLSSGLKSLKYIANIEFSKNFDEVRLIEEDSIEAVFEDYNEMINFKYKIDGVEFDEYRNIFQALEDGHKFYKAKSGKLINLRDFGIVNFFNVIDNLANREELFDGILEVDANKALFLKDSIDDKSLNFIRGNNTLNNICSKLNYRDNKEIETPENFNGTLRNYQITGLNYFKSLSSMGFGGILADEMGLGKTIQVIAFLLTEEGKKTLIITPTSLIYNWKDEFSKFAPSINVGIIHGTKSLREKVLNNYEEYDVLLSTYGTIKNDIDFYDDKIFDYCIIDEAQNIKNPKAQNTKIIKGINAKVKFALTGTPIENSLIELWSIFDFIMPGYLFDEKKFKLKYVNRGEEELKELKKLIKPFILRRVKSEVISELPEKIEIKKYVSMTAKQTILYKNYMKEVKLKLKSGEDNKFTIFSYLTRLRQLCQDPQLVREDYEGGSGKLDSAKEIINESILNNNKILVFSQFTSILKKLKGELEKDNIQTMYLDGSISAKERIKLVDEFNSNDNIKVFLISLKAGGTGLNLTSAKIVLHMDPWWNPAIEDQATDRAHRIGQKNSVEVIKLIAKDSIEEKIIQLQEEKREIINSVICDDNLNINNISKLTDEEILDLFK